MNRPEGSQPGSTYATEIDGCSDARPLLARVLLAAASRRWPLLPGLFVVRRRIQIRLGDHAPDRARSASRAGNYHAASSAREEADVGAARATAEAECTAALSREEPEHVVRRRH